MRRVRHYYTKRLASAMRAWPRKKPALILRTRTPLAAVIVAIDSAKRSGCATFACGKLQGYAEIRAQEPDARIAYLFSALTAARLSGLPCALVLEVPWGGGQRTYGSLTASAALWRDTWLLLGQPPKHVREVEAGDWRRALFGSGSLPREAARQLEALAARQIVERAGLSDACGVGGVGGDAAAAICLGTTWTHSLELQKALQCPLCAPTS